MQKDLIMKIAGCARPFLPNEQDQLADTEKYFKNLEMVSTVDTSLAQPYQPERVQHHNQSVNSLVAFPKGGFPVPSLVKDEETRGDHLLVNI